MDNSPQQDFSMLSLETHDRSDSTSENWTCYWRANILLTLITTTILLWIGDANLPIVRIAVIMLVLNTLIFPFHLIASSLWKSNALFYIMACIVMGGTPMFINLWGWGILFLGKTALRVQRCFMPVLIVCLLLLSASVGILKTHLVTVPDRFVLKTGNVFKKAVPAVESVLTPVAPQQLTAVRSEPTALLQPTPTMAPVPTPTPFAFLDFHEPNGFFSVQLPQGFSQRKQPYRDGTKNIFDYGQNLSLVILASTMDKPWNAEEAMNTKSEAIRQGLAGDRLARLKLDHAELTRFDSGSGYTLFLSDKFDNAMNMAAMVRVDQNISFSATITCTDTNQQPLYEQILFCLQRNLSMHGKNSPAPSVRSSMETGHVPTVETARERIRIQGVMEKNGIRHAIIGGQFHREGDQLHIQDGNQSFTFVITRIGKDAGTVELEPVRNP